jgi:TetR/AcrR family transcriptional repressor of nem operon
MTTPTSRRPLASRREERADTRDILVRAGLAQVLEGGWAATGIDKVLRSVGVPKGSFYYYFASKDAFGFALLDSYQAFYLKRLDRCFGPQAPVGLANQMAAFLAESIQGMQRFDWRRGCLVGALGQELGGLHDQFRDRLHAAMQQWEVVLAVALRGAQARGELKPTLDADRSARSFWAAWEGAVLRARLACSAVPLTEAVDDFLHLATH